MFQIFVPCVFIYLNFAFVCTSSSSTATLSFCYSFLFFSRFLALLYHLAFVLLCVVCNWVLDLVCQTLTVTKIWYSVTSHFFQRVWPSRETLFGHSGQEALYRSWWAVGTLHGGLCHLGMNYMKCCKALWVIGRLEMGYINASPFTILFNIFLWSQSLDYIYYESGNTWMWSFLWLLGGGVVRQQSDISNLFFLYAIFFLPSEANKYRFPLCFFYYVIVPPLYWNKQFITFYHCDNKKYNFPNKWINLCCMIRRARFNSKICLQVHALQ